jgi:hypothetical protein
VPVMLRIRHPMSSKLALRHSCRLHSQRKIEIMMQINGRSSYGINTNGGKNSIPEWIIDR